jgi:hypothetical protein
MRGSGRNADRPLVGRDVSELRDGRATDYSLARPAPLQLWGWLSAQGTASWQAGRDPSGGSGTPLSVGLLHRTGCPSLPRRPTPAVQGGRAQRSGPPTELKGGRPELVVLSRSRELAGGCRRHHRAAPCLRRGRVSAPARIAVSPVPASLSLCGDASSTGVGVAGHGPVVRTCRCLVVLSLLRMTVEDGLVLLSRPWSRSGRRRLPAHLQQA